MITCILMTRAKSAIAKREKEAEKKMQQALPHNANLAMWRKTAKPLQCLQALCFMSSITVPKLLECIGTMSGKMKSSPSSWLRAYQTEREGEILCQFV